LFNEKVADFDMAGSSFKNCPLIKSLDRIIPNWDIILINGPAKALARAANKRAQNRWMKWL